MQDEEIQLREGAETEMMAEDEQATFDPTNDMSDDDIAASLGFISTLGEQMLPPPQEEMAEEKAEEAPIEEGKSVEDELDEVSSEETGGAVDDQIAELEERLSKLEEEIENDEEGETTGPEGETE